MTYVDKLLRVSEAYCEAVSLSRSRVSTLVFNDGKVLDRLMAGGGITTTRLERGMVWFSAHWPDEKAAWPEGIARPPVDKTKGAAA